jgi:hypothetical protein
LLKATLRTTFRQSIQLKDRAVFRLWKPLGYERWVGLRAATPEACADEIFAAHPERSSRLLGNSRYLL